MTKHELKTLIATRPQTVTFQKIDGSIRELVCTLNMEYINKRWTASGGGSPEPDNIVRVWDLENDGWRCFKVDMIIDVQPLETLEIIEMI